MKPTVTAGLAVLAGVALFEAALIPGVVIGGAAVLAPKFLPGLRRRLKPLFGSTIHRPPKPAALSPGRRDVQVPAAAPGGFAIKRAIAKTITFRIIVTTLDFTTNYIVIGELATAAGLSAFAWSRAPCSISPMRSRGTVMALPRRPLSRFVCRSCRAKTG